jgi:hypothetical protein
VIELEQLTLWQRLVLTVAIIVVTLIVLFGISRMVGEDAAAQEARRLYDGIEFDPALLAVDRKALDEAYHAQITKLFGVWISQGAPQDAKNFHSGLVIARRAYAQARDQIRRREAEIPIPPERPKDLQ